MKSKLLLILILINSFITLSGCKLPEITSEEGDQINIGLLMPFTGDAQELGSSIRKACELAVWEINQQGGISGKKLKLRIADTQGDPVVAVAATRNLLPYKPIALIGDIFSGNTIEVANQIAIPNNLPIISPQSTSPVITTIETDTDLVFRTIASDAITGKFVGKYLYEVLQKQTVGVIYANDAYGAGLAAAFATSYQEAGGDIINYLPYPPLTLIELETYDFRPLTDSLFSGAPEAIYIISRPSAGAKITIAAEKNTSLQYHPLFIAADAMNNTEFLQNASPQITQGMYSFVSAVNAESVNYQRYVTAFMNKYHELPALFSENAYDAVYLLAYTMLMAQSEDPVTLANHIREVSSAGEKVSVNEFSKASNLLQDGVDIDYEGASGDLEMDEYGDIVSTFISVTISKGNVFEVVETIPFKKGG